MYLAQRDQRPGRGIIRSASGELRAEGKQHFCAIALHAFAEIVFGEAQVEAVAAVAGGNAAGARAESVDQPGNFLEIGRLQNLQAGGLARL
jgi:hypothetical protein